jgi:hypothetical protein
MTICSFYNGPLCTCPKNVETFKFLRSGPESYQVNYKGMIFLGDIDYIFGVIKTQVPRFHYEIIQVDNVKTECAHDFREMGFTISNMICIHCDREKL